MDSLGLDDMEAYGSPPPGIKTRVMPTHLSFDIYYIKHFGETLGYQHFKKDLTRILKDQKIATVLTHPAWFTRCWHGTQQCMEDPNKQAFTKSNRKEKDGKSLR